MLKESLDSIRGIVDVVKGWLGRGGWSLENYPASWWTGALRCGHHPPQSQWSEENEEQKQPHASNNAKLQRMRNYALYMYIVVDQNFACHFDQQVAIQFTHQH